MKTVIIITRGGEYSKECEAYKMTKDCEYKSGGFIHEYIRNQFEKAIKSKEANKTQYRALISELHDMPNPNDGRTEHKKLDGRGGEYPDWFYATKISPLLDRILTVEKGVTKAQICDKAIKGGDYLPDNKPYLSFQTDDSNVYFVFLDRIFGSIFADKKKYDYLIGDENRLDFITKICHDCGISEDDNNQNMLYIHDAEWYVKETSYAPLINGEFTTETSIKEQKEELKKYFKTIKVFMHTQNPIFKEIRDLNFSENYEDAEILRNDCY